MVIFIIMVNFDIFHWSHWVILSVSTWWLLILKFIGQCDVKHIMTLLINSRKCQFWRTRHTLSLVSQLILSYSLLFYIYYIYSYHTSCKNLLISLDNRNLTFLNSFSWCRNQIVIIPSAVILPSAVITPSGVITHSRAELCRTGK
jgi:hypothetical protein